MEKEHPERHGEKEKKKYVIEYDREGCIGAAACAAVSKNWVINPEDGKADYKEVEISEEELEENIEAARSCPVNVIHIKRKDNGERLI